MKRRYLGLLLLPLLAPIVSLAEMSGESVGMANFELDRTPTTPRNPENPSLDFTDGGQKVPFSPESEKGNSSKEKPRLIGTGNKGPFALDHVITELDFTSVEEKAGIDTYKVVGNPAFYEDKQMFIQLTDNRSSKTIGWKLQAQFVDKLISDDNEKHQLDGVKLLFPQGIARNDLNEKPESEDKANIHVYAQGVNEAAPVTIAETTGDNRLRGKGVSTLTWKSGDIALQVPAGIAKEKLYTFELRWTLVSPPVK